jgi:hypothetical protein
MTTPDRKGLDIEAILNDLYASEINASISWIWDGGFYVTLGNPQQAEGWRFRRSARLSHGCAIRPARITPTETSRENTAASYSRLAAGRLGRRFGETAR